MREIFKRHFKRGDELPDMLVDGGKQHFIISIIRDENGHYIARTERKAEYNLTTDERPRTYRRTDMSG